MTRWLLAVAIASAAACSPASPSGQVGGFLEGTWTGTITLTPSGQAPTTAPTTWQFQTMPNTSGLGYVTTIRSQHPFLPATIERVITAVVAPGIPPAVVSTQGGYESPRGCRGDFGSVGEVDAHSLRADFSGVDCGFQTFTGSVQLSR